MCFAPQRRAIFRHQTVQKVVRTRHFFHIFTCKMRFRATAACDFSTSARSKSGSRHCQCFVAFWLANVLRATAACHFWTSELQKLLRDCCVLCILTCKCASRHSGVPFFICLLNSYLRTRRFSEATFRTSGTTNHWENTAIRDFPNIFGACGSSF